MPVPHPHSNPSPTVVKAPTSILHPSGDNVSDTGPGISKDQQLRIFSRFSQLDNPETRDHGGAGLGLSIVKELAALLGGTVAVESEPNHGATFAVILPLDSCEMAAAENERGEAALQS